ncbi:hypothetical protein CVS47_00864 [Microbacterium lemovicicum]|uniref:Uncharacterized protein n=1 Tax=Microbacterium lemovicicum TaxID=1072463 RepID=A0A3Q9IX38_9MICO|nr:hypothetical protein [Microbacterium lemovicicum]AZS36263.1 hypothetical protein CVS47_00864 [Microbacterium lemovicicum]
MMDKPQRIAAVEQIEKALGGPGAVEAMWTTARGNSYRREWADRLWTAVLLVTRGEVVTFAHVELSEERPLRILLFTAGLVVIIKFDDREGDEPTPSVTAHRRGAPLTLSVAASEGVIDGSSVISEADTFRVVRFDHNWPGEVTATVTFEGMDPLTLTGEGLLDNGEASPLLRFSDEVAEALASGAVTAAR